MYLRVSLSVRALCNFSTILQESQEVVVNGPKVGSNGQERAGLRLA